MKKINLFLLLMGLVVCPFMVNARVLTIEEANEIMEELPIRENADSSCTFISNSISYDEMKENSCNISYEEYVRKHPFGDTYSESKLRDAYNLDITYCNSSFNYHIFNNFDDVNIIYDEDNKNVDIVVIYGGEEDQWGNLSGYSSIRKTCSVEYNENYDSSLVNKVKSLSSELDNVYSLYGYDVINSFYHYGGLRNDIWKNNSIMYRFPKIKEKLEDYPEFDYYTSAEGGAFSFIANSSGFIKAFKDDFLYGMHFYSANYIGLLLVDKDEEGTTLEKTIRALNTYFKGKVDFRFDEEYVYELNASGYDPANIAFGTEGVDYVGIDAILYMNDEQMSIGVVEMDKKDIKKFEVKAKDKGTGVHVYTNSYEVPVDSTLDVEDVTEDVSKKLDKKMYKVHSAYDIDVVKMTDGGFVKTIENGIDVYLPVSNRTLGEEMTVYHITDNEKGDGYKGVVVEVEGKQYVKFTTTHFSTYAVVEELTSVKNPDTGDNIILYTILMLISGSLLGGCLLMKPRRM